MKKAKINLIIDAVMFVLMAAITGIGLLMKYILIPGFERNAVYGKNVELFFWGMDRHQWGTIHLIISLCLIALLLLHIILHWKQVVCIFQKMIANIALRWIISVVLLALLLFLSLTTLFIKPEVHELASGESGHNHSTAISTNRQEHNADHLFEEIDINGRTTLSDAAKQFNIPVGELAAEFNIPLSEKDQTLGRVRKTYGFQINDLKKYISERTQKNK